MKRIILGPTLFLMVLLFCFSSIVDAKEKGLQLKSVDIRGAGATFPAPLYMRWIKEFAKTAQGFPISYDAVGSGEGTKRFMAGQVDFGASDSAMRDEQVAAVEGGVQLIPATAGIIVLAYNIPDFKGELRLSRKVYTDIFLGKIRYWDDERILKLNPGANIPHVNIATVTRSDSSGTTWAFTNHLKTVSREWREHGPGVGKKVDWPGISMSARYNEGVAVKISHSWGTIGYVEYGTALRAGLSMALLENRDGQYVAPGRQSGTATLVNTYTEMPADLRMFMPDPEGADSYPIITYSWLLLYKNHPDEKRAMKVKAFVDWSLTEGQGFAPELGYIPLPEGVVEQAREALANVQ